MAKYSNRYFIKDYTDSQWAPERCSRSLIIREIPMNASSIQSKTTQPLKLKSLITPGKDVVRPEFSYIASGNVKR